jgi:hypothetical protein
LKDKNKCKWIERFDIFIGVVDPDPDWIRIRIGSGFIGVPGSLFGSRSRRAKNDQQT